jgi:homocitrate synthase
MAGSVTNIRIVDTTLREGEQFARAHFTLQHKLEIAQLLDAFGVDYLELTSPVASPQSEHDLRVIAQLGLSARILTHTRCTREDVRHAIDCGVHGVNLLFGTSAWLQQASHGRDLSAMLAQATEAIRMVQDAGVEVRFSCEDAFRTDPVDLLRIYTAVDALGVNRVGIADTVGIATPQDVQRLVGLVRAAVRCDIEFHGHNDGGCAIANTHAAAQAGATHLDTTILGIGERNGIASLSGLIARMYLSSPELVSHYRLDLLHQIDSYVAQIVGIEIPFNSCITSDTAFTHKAGLHTNAVLRDPNAYEVLDPSMFGRERAVLLGHRLTGHNAIAHRARMLGIALDKQQCSRLTQEIKAQADITPLADDVVDRMIIAFHHRQTATHVENHSSLSAVVIQ